MKTKQSEDAVNRVFSAVLGRDKGRPILAAIDGVDGSGKTTFADRLALHLSRSGRQIIRASIDGFHNPRVVRYRQGRDSSRGYYEDSFNYKLLQQTLLDPLASGNLEYKEAAFDYITDTELELPWKKAKLDAILVMDGIFLLRPLLVGYWDVKVFLDVGFEVTVPRAVLRAQTGQSRQSEQEIVKAYADRYIPGQKLYFEESCPQQAADIVIDNTDFDNPVVLRSSFIGRQCT